MTDDINAISGEEGGYVPCDEVASPEAGSVQDSVAIAGDDEGFVPVDTAAAAADADLTDTNAVFGRGAAFVAKPCICEAGTLLASYNDHDQDDTHSWIGQEGFIPGGPVFYAGLAPTGGLSKIEHLSQFFGTLNSVTFWSVPVPSGATLARVHGEIVATAGSDSANAPDVSGVAWELVRGTWGGSAPGSLNPGGTVLASGALDFSAAGGFYSNAAIDTGMLVVTTSDFQMYLHFVTAPTGGEGFYRLALPDGEGLSSGPPPTVSAWALEFYDCA